MIMMECGRRASIPHPCRHPAGRVARRKTSQFFYQLLLRSSRLMRPNNEIIFRSPESAFQHPVSDKHVRPRAYVLGNRPADNARYETQARERRLMCLRAGQTRNHPIERAGSIGQSCLSGQRDLGQVCASRNFFNQR